MSAHHFSTPIKNKFSECAIPNPLQCCAFNVSLPISAEDLESKALSLAKEENVWLFDKIYAKDNQRSEFEIQVGYALEDCNDNEPVSLYHSLIL